MNAETSSFMDWINHHALLFVILVIVAIVLIAVAICLIIKAATASSYRKKYGSTKYVTYVAWRSSARRAYKRAADVLQAKGLLNIDGQEHMEFTKTLAGVVHDRYKEVKRKKTFEQAFASDFGIYLLVILAIRPYLDRTNLNRPITNVMRELLGKVPSDVPPWNNKFKNKLYQEINKAERNWEKETHTEQVIYSDSSVPPYADTEDAE